MTGTRIVVAVEQLRRPVPGGIGRYARGLLDGLASIGERRVELLASRHRGTGPDPLSAWGLPVHASMLPSAVLVAAWDRGLQPVRGARLVHSVSLAAPPVRPRRASGGPALVVTVHDLAWRSHPDATTPRGRRWHDAALARSLERADAFVVPSAPVAAGLENAGADRSRIRVIPHGVDHLPPPDPTGAQALLARFGVANGYLLTASTLEPRKNLERVVTAYKLARPSLPGDLPLVVVGPGGWGDTGLARLADDHVVAAGPVDDAVLVALYRGARAFVYAPLTEGFGLPPLEAMACGAPVVVSTTVPSTTPGALSVTARGETALRVDPATVDDLARALVRASADDRLRAALAANGKAFVETLSWRASAAAHLEWWESVS